MPRPKQARSKSPEMTRPKKVRPPSLPGLYSDDPKWCADMIDCCSSEYHSELSDQQKVQTPVNDDTVQAEQSPSTKGETEKSPATKGEDEKTPVKDEDEKSPATKDEDEKSPATKDEDEKTPVKDEAEMTPATKDEDEKTPVKDEAEMTPATKDEAGLTPVKNEFDTSDDDDTSYDRNARSWRLLKRDGHDVTVEGYVECYGHPDSDNPTVTSARSKINLEQLYKNGQKTPRFRLRCVGHPWYCSLPNKVGWDKIRVSQYFHVKGHGMTGKMIALTFNSNASLTHKMYVLRVDSTADETMELMATALEHAQKYVMDRLEAN